MGLNNETRNQDAPNRTQKADKGINNGLQAQGASFREERWFNALRKEKGDFRKYVSRDIGLPRA